MLLIILGGVHYMSMKSINQQMKRLT